MANPWGTYGGLSYTQTRDGRPVEEIPGSFTTYVNQAYKANGVVYAVVLARRLVFSEARFQFRRLINGRPGDLFGTSALSIVEKPWPNATTGEMLGRADQDVSLGGNFYVANEGDRLRRLRPDWMQIVLTAPPQEAVDSDVAGYMYTPGGIGTGAEPQLYLPDEVAHWSPEPDPDAMYRGMSWLTPILREVEADQAATAHKNAFFRNGAKPGLVVSLKESVREEQFKRFVRAMNETHQGSDSAYKTLYLAGGADVTVAGADLRQLDFRATQGAGETRICAAGGVPPVIVGLSEGLQAATYSNYASARRKFGDGWARPMWRSICAALETVVEVPGGAQLWYDDRDIAFLREDQRDAAEIQQTKASTIGALITAGFTPESSVASVDADDRSLLVHTGLVSVQLQPPGQGVPTDTAAGELPGETPPPGEAPPEAAPVDAARGYNQHQLRDWHGRWALTGGGKPGIVKVLEHANAPESKQELIDAADAVYGGEFAGFTTKVTKAYGYGKSKPDWLTVEGEIRDKAGNRVGEFERLLDRDKQGRRYVYHSSLTLDRDARGQGFAEAFNGAAEQWYRDNGVEYVELNANIDVGGYAWARQGYTFADEDAKAELDDRLAEAIADYDHKALFAAPADREALLEQVRQARELLDRSRRAKTLEEAPTPYEYSQVGRPEGATGRDARWLGKDALLGSDWEAVKWL